MLLFADTVPPTAYITAPNAFTNALNFSVNISFNEPCVGEGGFRCLSANACNVSRWSTEFRFVSDFSQLWSCCFKKENFAPSICSFTRNPPKPIQQPELDFSSAATSLWRGPSYTDFSHRSAAGPEILSLRELISPSSIRKSHLGNGQKLLLR